MKFLACSSRAISAVRWNVHQPPDRLCPGGGTQPSVDAGAVDLRSLHAAISCGLPLALGTGAGPELRRPLGIAIVGGLLLFAVLDTVYDAGDLHLPEQAWTPSAKA